MRVSASPGRAPALAAVAFVWMLASAPDAAACSCVSMTPCEAFGRADAVFVGNVVSQKERDAREGGEEGSGATRKFQVSKLHVEEAFAGVGAGAEVEVETDIFSSCAFPLSTGLQYLVYAYRDEDAPEGRLATNLCMRTGSVEDSAEDLEYLRGEAARAGAVVQGVVSYAGAAAGGDGPPVGADTVGVTTVVAEGGGRRVEARVGAGGRYQFRGLPPGKYRVGVPLPDELTVEDPYHPDIAADLGIKEQHEIEAPARGCLVKDIAVADNGRISGRVTDAEGQPVADLKVELRRPREPGAAGGGADDEDERLYIRTDEDGRYAFKGLSAGRYLIGVRLGEYLDSDDPEAAFRRTFYPGVRDEREAVAVSLGRGQSVTRRDFQLGPRLRERTVSGVVLRKDGRPAAGAQIRYQARTADRKRSTLVLLEADERGRFSFKGYEGTAFLVGAFAAGAGGAKGAHAHEVEVGPSGAPPRLRLVLNQPDTSCGRCRDFDEFEGGKP